MRYAVGGAGYSHAALVGGGVVLESRGLGGAAQPDAAVDDNFEVRGVVLVLRWCCVRLIHFWSPVAGDLTVC